MHAGEFGPIKEAKAGRVPDGGVSISGQGAVLAPKAAGRPPVGISRKLAPSVPEAACP